MERRKNPKVTVGFVPTMGALHQGHVALVSAAVSENDIAVCSIFVNPTQFGEKKDLETYPKPIENDIELLIDQHCGILFLPEILDVYPADYEHKHFEIGDLETKIEGEKRPGHFQGVCNVLHQFFVMIEPTRTYFGQKDFQQTAVVNRLLQLMQSGIKMEVVPIVREEQGLAMSSRNVRLSDKGRKNAAFIYKSLLQLKEDLKQMPLNKALEKAEQFITANKGAEIDYLTIVDRINLDPLNEIGDIPAVALVVVRYEGVRLLDNLLL